MIARQEKNQHRSSAPPDFDAIVVGAGFAGLYMLYRLRGMGLRVRVIEAGDGVGGTWYWNRYPGARCDVQSLEYSYSFSRELQEEWDWSELMPSQPEVERYLNHVADRFDLRKDIQLGTRVTAAHFREDTGLWTIATDQGTELRAPYCIMATGCLSAPLRPEIPGADSFRGLVLQTSLWPKDGVDLRGLRVGMIGTGSSGVQATPEIAQEAGHLYVFQRTPTYTFPSMNRPIDDEYRRRFKDNYDEVRKKQRDSLVGISNWNFDGFGGWLTAPTMKILETPEEERKRLLDEMGWRAIRLFADIRESMEANNAAVELYGDLVRLTVRDPEVAEALSPRDYPLGCKRQVIDCGYFEAFNRDNVTLVDLRNEGIEEITARGIRTSNREYELDVLVYATGFDAMTGALNRIDIRGRAGRSLKDKWADGPRTYLGIQTAGFPNLFTVTGPGSPSVLSNMVVSIEQHVEWISDCLAYLRAQGGGTIEATVDAEDAWVEHVNEVARGTMYTAPSCHSWYLGVNVPGKTRVFMPYVGGVGRYAQRCADVVAKGYEGFAIEKAPVEV